MASFQYANRNGAQAVPYKADSIPLKYNFRECCIFLQHSLIF